MSEIKAVSKAVSNTVSKDVLSELAELSTPEISDGVGIGYSNTMDYEIKPVFKTKKIVGPALTVKVPVGEGSIVADALKMIREGDVIVIAGHGHCKTSYWGDHRSICAKFMKAEGVVIDGACRDLDGCEEAGFPIYAKGVTPATAAKSGAGEINVPVSCGGVLVNPGDIVVADRNGVIVLPPDDEYISDVIRRAKTKKMNQEWTIEEMFRTGVCQPKVLKKPQ